MASDPTVLDVVNFLNVWGLILIGSGLFLGIFARTAVYAGILMLFFYYIAYPPFQGYNFGVPQEGHYLLVDKTFIELAALVILALFPCTLEHWRLEPSEKAEVPGAFAFPHEKPETSAFSC